MSHLFSASGRTAFLQQMSSQVLDVLIIGGGITGAGIAWDASLRGMKAGLVEMNDFASGTSSRSTKLIHGGLRYLKQGEVRLVKEVGRERTLLHHKLPHLVTPLPMLLPLYKGNAYGPFSTSVGLFLYDRLAGVDKEERRSMLTRAETMQQEPLLLSDSLVGGGFYYEYRTDDARLTLEIIKSAAAAGALAVNYAQAAELIYQSGKCVGATVVDRITQTAYPIYAKTIVNATGPWSDTVRAMDDSLEGKRVFLTKGVHLVFDRMRFPVSQAVYFDSPDGRMIFVIPRQQVTYIGTTDTPYSEEIGQPHATAEDRDYLLAAVNQMFPSLKLVPEDVIACWAGLRPLIYEEGKGPSELSRKDEIFHSPSGLLTIAGGKLTGFRKMAEKVVDLLAQTLRETTGQSFGECQTHLAQISSGAYLNKAAFRDWLAEIRARGQAQGMRQELVDEWVALYGSNVQQLMNYADEVQSDQLEYKCWVAQLRYSVQEEMAVTAVDVLLRRTGYLYFKRHEAERMAPLVVEILSELLGWTDEEAVEQLKQVEQEIRSTTILPSNNKTIG